MRTMLGLVIIVSLAVGQTPKTDVEWYTLGLDLEAKGKTTEAIAAFEKARAMNAPPFLPGFRIAANHAALGHTAEAVAALDADARFQSLRVTPEFKKDQELKGFPAVDKQPDRWEMRPTVS